MRALPAALLAVYLVVVLPPTGVLRYRRLCRHPSSRGRLAGYASGMARQWLLAAAALAALAADGVALARAGLTWRVDAAGRLLPGLALAVAVGLGLTVVLRRRPAQLRRLLRPVAALLPVSVVERRAFAAVALTAGVTEELLYRGLLTQLAGQVGLRPGGAALATSVAFGLAHAYQGPLGVGATALAGYGLAGLAQASGSLVLPMILHTLVDLRILLLLPRDRGGAAALAGEALAGEVGAASPAAPNEKGAPPPG